MDKINISNPGQRYVNNWIIYEALGEPDIKVEKWKLIIDGNVQNKVEFSFNDLKKMENIEYISDFNCVTKWSMKGVEWKGPSLKNIIDPAIPSGDAKWAMFISADGYTTPVPIEYAMDPYSIVAIEMDGRPIPRENGFPARPFIPSLYGWKSAKWLTEIKVMKEYEDGFWEKYGYHEIGRVDQSERFKGNEWKSIKRNSKVMK